MAEWVESPILVDRSIRSRGLEPKLSQTNDLLIYTSSLIARYSALLIEGNAVLSQWQDNVTEWGIVLWCWQPVLPVAHYYQVAMSAHDHP